MGVWDFSHVISSGTEGDATRCLSVLMSSVYKDRSGMHVLCAWIPALFPTRGKSCPAAFMSSQKEPPPFSNETAERGSKRNLTLVWNSWIPVSHCEESIWTSGCSAAAGAGGAGDGVGFGSQNGVRRALLLFSLQRYTERNVRLQSQRASHRWRLLLTSAANRHKLNHAGIWLRGVTSGWPLHCNWACPRHLERCLSPTKHLSFSRDAKSGLNDNILYSSP